MHPQNVNGQLKCTIKQARLYFTAELLLFREVELGSFELAMLPLTLGEMVNLQKVNLPKSQLTQKSTYQKINLPKNQLTKKSTYPKVNLTEKTKAQYH